MTISTMSSDARSVERFNRGILMQINPGFRLFEFTQETWDRRYIDYRAAWNQAPQSGKTLRMPIHLDIESTNACNLRCPFCVREYMKDATGMMSADTYRMIMKELMDDGHGVRSIKLNWRGEPTLHKQLPWMVRTAKQVGITEVSINTNGTCLDANMAARLIDSGLDRIIFSIDSIDEKKYREQRVGGELVNTISNLKKLIDLRKINDGGFGRPYIRVQKIDLPEVRDENERFVAFFKDMGVDAVAINTYKEKNEGIVDWEPLPCCQPFQRMGITWDGNYFACCQGQLFPYIGNVASMSVHAAWHGTTMTLLREAHASGQQANVPQCRKCETTMPEAKK
jgi:pyruvate-formate lyase-activating enzyme